MALADKFWKQSGTAFAAAALLGSLALPAAAQTARSAGYVPPQGSRTVVTPGTYVFTGPVARGGSNSFTVNHNGILRPVMADGAVVTRIGRRISVRNLRRGETVRVTAVQVGANRWDASRVNVVQPRVARGRYRDGYRDGERVATVYSEERIVTSRARYGGATPPSDVSSSPYSGVGVVESVNKGEQSFKVKIGKNSRRVYAEFARIGGVTRVRDLQKGDRVRVLGGLYGRDVFADRVVMLD